MKRTFLILVSFVVLNGNSQNKYQEDFDYFWNLVNAQYAYFDVKQTDWDEVKLIYNKRVESIKEDWEFIHLIELMKHELYDPHFSLNKNVAFSFRLIPNDLDAYIQVKNDRFYVKDIRQEHTITNFDINVGDEIVAVNGNDMTDVLRWNLPASIKDPNDEVKEYFANLIFAGKHNQPRNIKVSRNGKTINLELPKATLKKKSPSILDFEVLSGNVGYIKINNSLGNNNMIKEFPKTVDKLEGTKAIIIDLRNTHGGGNAEVAKSIMGKFIKEMIPYQVHERVGLEREFGIKRKFIELLSPLENPYLKPVYILVGRWTGSVGEAIAQGFSEIKTAKVVGTEMAKLLGAITCNKLPVSRINVCFPFEKLYHVNGTPRENFIPEIYTNTSKEAYKKALELANE